MTGRRQMQKTISKYFHPIIKVFVNTKLNKSPKFIIYFTVVLCGKILDYTITLCWLMITDKNL